MLRSLPSRLLAYLLVILLIVLGTGIVISPAAEAPAEEPQEEQPEDRFEEDRIELRLKGSLEEGIEEEAANPEPTNQSSTYEIEEVEEYWAMPDGANLPVSVFYPVTEEEDEGFPAIIFVHPWVCDKLLFEELAKDYASRGYVGVSYTVRGWYDAEGQINCMDPELELRDLSHIITLVSQDERFPVLWDDKGPVVGVTGYSMGGCHTFLIAPRKNPRPGDPGDQRVRAVVPMHGGADLLYSIYPNNAVKMLWGSILLIVSYIGNPAGFFMHLLDIVTNEDTQGWDKLYELIDAMWGMFPLIGDVTPDLAWIYGTAMQRREEDEDKAKQYFKVRSARYWCDEEFDGVVEHPITAPMLIVAGWNDDIFYANEGLRVLSSCMDAPGRMIITDHGHIGGMGGNFFVDLPENPESEWVNEQVERWFDYHLKGIDNDVDEDPAVVYYRHHDPDNYGEAFAYPLPGTQQVSMYMSDGAGGQADLSTESPQGWLNWPDILINMGVTGAVSLFYFQDVTEMVGGETMDIPTRIKLFEIPFTECDFITEPLEEDITIMGAPMLELYYQSQQRFAQLSPFLYEVTPGGEEILVSRGWYEGQKLEAWEMADTAEQPIEMQACYHRFPAGSRIKLELATADLAMTWPYWGFNIILLHHSSQAPSRIILPMVPNEN